MLSMSPELARAALEAAPDAMVVVDQAGIVRFANRQTCAIFGYTHDEIIDHEVEQLLPERFRAEHVRDRHGYWDAMQVRPMGAGLQLLARRKDGSEFPVEISLSPIRDANCVWVAAAIRDATERKRAEADLNAARDSAEQAMQSAERANRGKSRFLAMASHDLRQPLQTLALLNGTLRRITHDADVAEVLQEQELAIAAMSRLLNALLDISKLESGAIKPEPTDFAVAALFEQLRREFSGLAASKGLKLEVQAASQVVRSDPSLVEQILRNLVSNAIKYTQRGSVCVRSLSEGNAVRVEVLDTGIGIPVDQIPLICDEFYQISGGRGGQRDGYGLGLSIVQRLVSLLELKLDVRSEIGRGSTFALMLPASTQRVSTARILSFEAAGRTPSSHEKQHVLLVEDDPAVRDATRMLLRVEGYRVTPAASLAEAVAAARLGQPINVVVADYHLSEGETGVQVISALRKIFGSSLKAVLVTGDTSSAVSEMPLDSDVRLASKPINAEELLALLRELCAGGVALPSRI
jgi:PAS domain S-box-containing protein